jgi:DNA replication ATP-dependent helicase Dna2
MNDFHPKYYYDRIESVIFDEEHNFIFNENENKIVFLSVFDVFKEFIDKIYSNNRLLSSSFYSKLSYILNSSDIPKNLFESYFQFRILSQRLVQNKKHLVSEGDLKLAVFLTCNFIYNFSNEEIPSTIDSIIANIDFDLTFFGYEKGKIEEHKYLRLVVREKIIKNTDSAVINSEIICYSDIYGECSVLLYGQWADIYDYTQEGSILNLLIPYMKNGKIIATVNSIVVLEPDILLDATEITSCYLHNGNAYELYFLNLFADTTAGKSMLVGNLVNYIFDEIIQNDTHDFNFLFTKGISQKPLSLMTFDNFHNIIEEIKITLENHYRNIINNKSEFNADIYSIEPSFMSPIYGLQGRLDLMTEHNDNKNRKDIIELKSGKAPSPDLFCTINEQKLQTGIWVNHHIQTLCYNILLDSSFEERTGTSRIYYSSSVEYPLRNAPDNIHLRAGIIALRNKIINSLIELSNGKYTVFKGINSDLAQIVPSFIQDKIKAFLFTLKNMTKQEKSYFKLFTSFITREIMTVQIGDDKHSSSFGASSIWQLSKQQKKSSYLIITDLVPELSESDLDRLHIHFSRKIFDDISVFRKGDICILYPEEYEGEEILHSQLIKCVIREIDEKHISVSLRNKISSMSIFFKYDKWTLEQDYNLINSKKLYGSLFQIFKIPKEKRDIILGNHPTETLSIDINAEPYDLSEQQKIIFEQALKAKDYYLIQGPPGTGKTSYMLKNIVKYYYDNTASDILIAAYTNRAVDEICNIMKSATDINILRTGSKQSSEHHDIMISYLSDILTPNELYEKIKSVRVYISTVSSLIQNPEIFSIKNFKYAIIDEASQILEPQIMGIISSVDKFILIGDEKQLPAIVTQPDKMLVKNESLLKINLENPKNSYFHRMIRLNMEKGYAHSYGMLEYQARMHREIMDFAGRYFYSGKLKIFSNLRQNSTENIFKQSNSWNLISSYRTAFVNTAPEKHSKVNQKEAKLVCNLVEEIIRLKNGKINIGTIGIISPFRAQCAEIKRRLPFEYRKLIDVETVERFQGSERDFIIYSFAVNYEEQITNVSDIADISSGLVDRKLNVAITRAREYLIIFGSRKVLSKNNIYDMLIHHIENKGNLLNFWDL